MASKGRKRKRDHRVTGVSLQSSIYSCNNELAVHANRRQLVEAKRIFRKLCKNGLANDYTYGIMINAHINCGDMVGALKVFEEMKSAKLQPSCIIYTSLIKGFCSGPKIRLKCAFKLVQQMENIAEEADPTFKSSNARTFLPNLRTVKTLLRGCLRVGELDRAKWLIFRAYRSWGLLVDSSCYEYLIVLRCQVFQISNLLIMIKHLEEQCILSIQAKYQNPKKSNLSEKIISALVQILTTSLKLYVLLLNCCMILEERNICQNVQKSIDFTLQRLQDRTRIGDILDKSANMNKSAMNSRNKVNKSDVTLDSIPIVFAMHSGKSKNDTDTRKQSNAAFRTHATENAKEEYLFLKSVLEKSCKPGIHERYINVCKRTLIFIGFDKGNIAQHLIHALQKRFGLNTFLKRTVKAKYLDTSGKRESTTTVSSGSVRGQVMNELIDGIRMHMFNVLKGGKLHLEKLYHENLELPIKLEIGSGKGEFALANALLDKHIANWIVLELRADRLLRGMMHQCYRDCSNIANLCGDAFEVLNSYFKDKSVNSIFVNFPEPPQQTKSELHSEAKYLLNPTFIMVLHRILVDHGTITIVTDNRWLASFLCKEYSQSLIKENFCCRELCPKKYTKFVRIENIIVYEGIPDKSIGHKAGVSTYFDSLWQTGAGTRGPARGAQKTRRFVLYLVKKKSNVLL